MRLASWIFALALALHISASPTALFAAQTTSPCTLETPCPVADSNYVALPPQGWDGVSPLRMAVFLHGYHQPAAEVLSDQLLIAAFSQRGWLFVVPNTDGEYWAVPGSPQAGRDDIGYLKQVIADVHRRFPVDDRDMTGLGFSLGASYLWTIACQQPAFFQHYIAFSGAFWRPHPDRCVDGKLDLIHIHGTDDKTVPIHGRALRNGAFRQGDAEQGMKFWLASKRCVMPMEPSTPIDLTCEMARNCEGHASIRMCLHSGGHWVDPRWVGWALDQQSPGTPQ